MRAMTVEFDPDADAAYIRLADGQIETTSEIAPGLIVDWNGADEPLGLEVLYVRSRLGTSDLQSFAAGLVEGVFATRRHATE